MPNYIGRELLIACRNAAAVFEVKAEKNPHRLVPAPVAVIVEGLSLDVGGIVWARRLE